MKQHGKFYGPLITLLAAICFAGGGLALKMTPWNGLAINSARSMVAFVATGAYMFFTKHKPKVNLTVLGGAVCTAGVSNLYAMANKLTTAGNAIILQYITPVWIMIFMFLIFKKKPHKQDVIMTCVVAVGIMFFFVDSLSQGNMLGNFLGALSGVFYAFVFMLNEFEDGDPTSSLLFGFLISSVVFSPMVMKETDFSMSVILAILFLGLVQQSLAYMLLAEGTKYTEPVTASLIATAEPILNPILVAIFWGEMLTPLCLVGASIVLVAIVVYNVYNVVPHKQKAD